MVNYCSEGSPPVPVASGRRDTYLQMLPAPFPMDVSIIGGAGHVGLSMGLAVSQAEHTTRLIDKDSETLDKIASGQVPFKEEGADDLLEDGLAKGLIHTSVDMDMVSKSDILVITVGTPTDEHHNPDMENLFEFLQQVRPYLRAGHLIVLRSTVYPGTTAILRDEVERYGFVVGEDLFLSYAPERIVQHKAIEGMINLPQLIGVFDDESYEASIEFFRTFIDADCFRLGPTEAEIGKLFTNMWRYITFAMANEFYYISESFAEYYDVNIHRILDRTQANYPRFNPPTPGANVGGPCLTKDGWFLVDNIPYNELVSTAFQINEGMPAKIIDRLVQERPDPDRIVILGMTFKADSDDKRNSVAFKMEKQLFLKGYRDIVRIEPHLDGYDDWEDMADADWVILMTPHEEFNDIRTIHSRVGNSEAVYCDVWGFWEDMKYESRNGYFTGRELERTLS